MASAVLLPGSASTADFVRRAFGELLAEHDVLPWAPSSGDARRNAEDLAHEVSSLPAAEPLLIIGVSVGAHAAAWWASAATRPITRLVLALPAWTGAPDDVAAMTALAAARIAAHGVAAQLAQLEHDFPDDWVTTELVRAWSPLSAAALVRTLKETANSSSPTLQDLQAIDMPTLVVGLRDDPLHPWQVARDWANAIASGHLVSLDRAQPQAEVCVFGRACAKAWATNPASGEQS